jgi:hypothetical protein
VRIPSLLRENAGFRRLWCSQTVSIAGDHVGLVALPLVGVLALHAGPAQMGLLTAAARGRRRRREHLLAGAVAGLAAARAPGGLA